jgi:hypothetical protein
MVVTVFDMVNKLYKAFMSDLFDVNNKTEGDRLRKKINRLSKEESSLSHDIYEISMEYEKLLNSTFKSKRIINYLIFLFEQIMQNYQNYLSKDISIMDTEDELRAFWNELMIKELIPNIIIPPNVHYDENDINSLNLSILKDKDIGIEAFMGIFFWQEGGLTPFYKAINEIKKYFSINSDNELARQLDIDIENKKISNWKNKGVLPNNFLEVKIIFEKLFDQHLVKENKREEINYLLYLSLAWSRLVKIILEDTKENPFLFGGDQREKEIYDLNKRLEEKYYYSLFDIQEMERFLQRISKFPGDTVNRMRVERVCKKIDNNKDRMEPLNYYFVALYYYLNNTDMLKAKDYYIKAFETGRYCLGPHLRVMVKQLLHCCRITDDRKRFNHVFNWYRFIFGVCTSTNNGEIEYQDKTWEILNIPGPIEFSVYNETEDVLSKI